jgi:hypothetical protein
MHTCAILAVSHSYAFNVKRKLGLCVVLLKRSPFRANGQIDSSHRILAMFTEHPRVNPTHCSARTRFYGAGPFLVNVTRSVLLIAGV